MSWRLPVGLVAQATSSTVQIRNMLYSLFIFRTFDPANLQPVDVIEIFTFYRYKEYLSNIIIKELDDNPNTNL
jgi:hypothetical protein